MSHSASLTPDAARTGVVLCATSAVGYAAMPILAKAAYATGAGELSLLTAGSTLAWPHCSSTSIRRWSSRRRSRSAASEPIRASGSRSAAPRSASCSCSPAAASAATWTRSASPWRSPPASRMPVRADLRAGHPPDGAAAVRGQHLHRCVPLARHGRGRARRPRADRRPAGLGWSAALALFCTVGPMALFFAGLGRVGPSTAAIASTIEPAGALRVALARA